MRIQSLLWRFFFCVVFSVSSVACAMASTSTQGSLPSTQARQDQPEQSQSESNQSVQSPQDPYERFNRPVFNFNDHLDRYILKPIATLYTKIMPKPLNQGIHNVFNNLNTIPTIINDCLQLNGYQVLNDTWRLGINTTLGIGGLFDVATRLNLPIYHNDFGLTLAKYGYTESRFIVIPFFGSMTLRDGLGMPVDYYGFSVYPYIEPTSAQYGVYAWSVVDMRAQLLQYQDVMEEVAFDKYAFVRNAYMQRRAYQIQHLDDRRDEKSYHAVMLLQGSP